MFLLLIGSEPRLYLDFSRFSFQVPTNGSSAARRAGTTTSVAAKRKRVLADIDFLLMDRAQRDNIFRRGIYRRENSRRRLLLIEDTDIMIALALSVHAIDGGGQCVAVLGNDACKTDNDFSFFPVRSLNRVRVDAFYQNRLRARIIDHRVSFSAIGLD